MKIHHLLLALMLGTGIAHAQVVSPLGGSTNNPQGAQRPAPAAASGSHGRTSAAAAPATTTAVPSTTAAAKPHHKRRTLTERFTAANTTHDGKLTLEQARAGRLVAVVRDWDQIDSSKRGYVTLDQIKAHQTAQRKARRAAREAAAAHKP
jgi:hypothetical protein